VVLRRAIANRKIGRFKSGKDRPGDLMHVGNLYRLLGDREMATRHFERARQRYAEMIAETMERYDYPDPSLHLSHMIPASFLVGRDEEVGELVEQLRLYYRGTDLAAFGIAKLAAARQAGDADLAAEVVNRFARPIQQGQGQIWNSGGLLWWDWYEIAVEAWQDLVDQRAPQGALPASA
jgi:hypothetical protein